VCIKGSLGSIFLCAAYCQFDSETENNRQDEDYSLQSCLAYLDAVLLLASSTPAILGLDANAASPMWFNKLPSHAEGLANYSRGELLSEWILTKGAVVPNPPSRSYTFDNNRSHSDIDVTLANFAGNMLTTYEWRVDEWELRDHNIIYVVANTSTVSAAERLCATASKCCHLRNSSCRSGDSVKR